MTDLSLRPRADPLVRAWSEMIQTDPNRPGYDFTKPRQARFEERVEAFCAEPTPDRFDAIWSPDHAVEHANPGGAMLRSTFDGDIDDLAAFVETLQSAPEYNQHWEDRVGWLWASGSYTRG